MTRLVAVVSGKGGCGKTTVAVNLGVGFSSLSRDSVVVDTDLTTPNVAVHIGTFDYAATLHDVLLGGAAMQDAVFFHHPTGLKFVPGHMSLARGQQVAPQSLGQLRHLLDGVAPVAILDSASGVDQVTQHTIMAADEVIGVTTATLPSVLDTLRALNFARQHGRYVRGVVVNRVIGSQYEMAIPEIESMLDAKTLAVVPEDARMVEAVRVAHPIVSSHPQSPAALALKKLAESFL